MDVAVAVALAAALATEGSAVEGGASSRAATAHLAVLAAVFAEVARV